MANYDFNNLLSPERFQDLARDILQIKYSKYAESFKKVKDDGIDIRLNNNGELIYGQAKRYTNLSSLKYDLKTKELKKVKKHNPDRYILITSLDYTPKDKQDIMETFKGYIKDSEDIISRTDINNFLSNPEYQSVKRKYYELWMDSFEVMEELLDNTINNHIYRMSKNKLKDIIQNEKTYIEGELSDLADEIISKNNCILITGEAGIGKTSLAYHLIYNELQKDDSRFIYAYCPDDIMQTYNEDITQIFMIDDFWGSVLENSYDKREEKKFIDVINMINNSRNKKLILTSREYILEEGLKKHPKVYKELLNNKIILKLRDFSEILKVKILFKHLDESSLDWGIIDQIACEYERIINHSMYNPRLIAGYINKIDREPKKKTSYINELLEYLDNPESFIEEIFEEQTEAGKIILILMLLMRRETEIRELKELFYAYVDRNNCFQKSDFSVNVKKLDGNLISIYKDELYEREDLIYIEFQNPSIEEYVYKYFANNAEDYAEKIINSTNNLNLLASLCGVYLLSTDYKRDFYNRDTGHKLVIENIDKSIEDKIINSYNDLIFLYKKDVADGEFSQGYSELNKIELLIKINKELNSNNLREFLQDKLDIIFDGLVNKKRYFTYEDMYVVIKLLETVKDNFYLIKYTPREIIEGYFSHIKFAVHYSIAKEFEEIYPKEYLEFISKNKTNIVNNILNCIIDNISFYLSDLYYDDLDLFVDLELPEILEEYNISPSKEYLKRISDMIGRMPPELKALERIARIKYNPSVELPELTKVKRRKRKRGKLKEIVDKELIKLLGKDRTQIVDNYKKLIFDKIKNKNLAKQIYISLEKIQKSRVPMSIYDEKFARRVLTFLNKTNKEYIEINDFMEEFIDYWIGKIPNRNDIKNKLGKFCYEMCMQDKKIWRETELKNDSIFLEEPEIIDFLIEKRILVKNYRWVEFYNDIIFWYFVIINSIQIEENAMVLMNKFDSKDIGSEWGNILMLLYSSINREKFNKEFIEPELKKYIKEIEDKDVKNICINILKGCEYELVLNERGKEEGGSILGVTAIDILEYTNYYFSENIENQLYDIIKNKEKSKLLKLKYYKDKIYCFNFLECVNDEETYELFKEYGIWEEVYGIYKQCDKILNLIKEDSKVDIRKIKV